MEAQEFLTEYRNISNKLKKRFLRRPNVSEASDHFRQLGRRLDDGEEPQYAAFCHLATSRCEQTIGNSPGEIEALTAAARSFLRAEMEVQALKCPSYEEHLTAAIASFRQAAKLQEEGGRGQLAACLLLELGEALQRLQRPTEALQVYKRAAGLLENHIGDWLSVKVKIADCYISTPDHHNALLVLSEVANFAAEHDPCNLYTQMKYNTEVLMVLLLLLVEPSPHNTAPHLLAVLERYQGGGETESGEVGEGPSPDLPKDTAILLQSAVMAVQSKETEALLYLQDELSNRLTDQQTGLLKLLVNNTIRKV